MPRYQLLTTFTVGHLHLSTRRTFCPGFVLVTTFNKALRREIFGAPWVKDHQLRRGFWKKTPGHYSCWKPTNENDPYGFPFTTLDWSISVKTEQERVLRWAAYQSPRDQTGVLPQFSDLPEGARNLVSKVTLYGQRKWVERYGVEFVRQELVVYYNQTAHLPYAQAYTAQSIAYFLSKTWRTRYGTLPAKPAR